MDDDKLVVDATTGKVGVGTTEPTESLDIVGNLNLQKVSNTATIQLNSNVVTEFARSKKLIKYPRVAMTAATTAGYTASASSNNYGVDPAYDLFNNNISGDYWHTDYPLYSSTSPYTYTGGNALSTYNGEWVTIDLSENIKLDNVSLYNRNGYTNQAASQFVILGSSDNSNWNLLSNVTSTSWTDLLPNNIIVNSEQYYRYYGFVFTHANSSTNISLGEIELYGVPEYDPEAHGTDTIMRSIPNVPNTDWLEVYYDGQDYTSMPATVTDKSGNGATGTPNGGVGFDTEYKAFTFDAAAASKQYLSSSTPVTGNYVHSISIWFKGTNLTSTLGDTLLWIGDNVDNKRIEIYLESDLVAYNFRNNTVRTSTTLLNNRWYHLTVTYNGIAGVTGREIYIDGVKQSTTFDGNSQVLDIDNNTLNLGGFSGTTSTYMFTGSIANFRLFNRALTGDEIWQLYAYQKEYFDVSPDVVTFKGGRLGIGTTEPRAVLDVQGNIKVNNYPFSSAASLQVSTTQNQSLNSTVYTLVTFNVVQVDTINGWDATNNRYLPSVPGYYLVNAQRFNIEATGGFVICNIRKNGVDVSTCTIVGTNASYPMGGATALVYLNGMTDYVDVTGYTHTTININTSRLLHIIHVSF